MDDYWIPGQRMMGDIKFLDSLRAFDKDNVPQHIMEKIRIKYINMELFDPNNVKKVRDNHRNIPLIVPLIMFIWFTIYKNNFFWIQVSTACEGLCRWVHAIEVYDRVIKIVSPKKAKLAEAETELARQMDKLNEKRAQLQQVMWSIISITIVIFIYQIFIWPIYPKNPH